MKRLKLRRGGPGEQLLGQIKDNVIGERACDIGGMEVRYVVFSWPGGDDPIGSYDEEGTIYVSDNLLRTNPKDADLTAFHEQLEINRKRAGRSHAYAHRRALLAILGRGERCGGPEIRPFPYVASDVGVVLGSTPPRNGQAASRLLLVDADDGRRALAIRRQAT